MKEYFINIINLVLIFVSAVLLSLYAYIKAKMRKSSRNKMNTYFIIDKVIGFLLSIFLKFEKVKVLQEMRLSIRKRFSLCRNAMVEWKRLYRYFQK